jgi:hypothetical protein
MMNCKRRCAAKILGIAYSTPFQKMKKYGIIDPQSQSKKKTGPCGPVSHREI